MFRNTCLSRNFTLGELTHTNRSTFLDENRELSMDYLNNLHKLAFVLQFIRDECNFPLRINSGFRSPSLNKEVGGVAKSLHLKGLAADIRLPDDFVQRNRLLLAIRTLQDVGIITYSKMNLSSQFIHISIFNDG